MFKNNIADLNLINQVDEIKENKTGNFYIDCKLENEQPVFTYQLKEGWSDLKNRANFI